MTRHIDRKFHRAFALSRFAAPDMKPGTKLMAHVDGKDYLVSHLAKVGKDFKVRMADGSKRIIEYHHITPINEAWGHSPLLKEGANAEAASQAPPP